jgi:hypothetical protein
VANIEVLLTRSYFGWVTEAVSLSCCV